MDINYNKALLVSQKYIADLVGIPHEQYGFFIVLGIGLLFSLIFSKLIASFVGGSLRNFIFCAFAVILPFAVTLYGYAIGLQVLPQYIPQPDSIEQASWILGFVLGFLTLLVISPFLLGIGFIRTTIVVAITAAACAVAMKFSIEAVKSYGVGAKNVKKANSYKLVDEIM